MKPNSDDACPIGKGTRARDLLKAIAAFTFLFFAVASTQAQPQNFGMRMHVINIGQGEAILLEFQNHAALVDTGVSTRSRLELESANADYFRLQTQKMSERKNAWQAVSENPVGIVSAITALVAATIAFLSFIFNYRDSRRTQRETQFFEALKRLGDNGSPGMRLSSVGLLSQMAKNEEFTLSSTFPFLRKFSPYRKSVLDHLSSVITLENNPTVLDSIANELLAVGFIDERAALRKMYLDNIDNQLQLFDALAEYAAFFEVVGARLETISQDTWDILSLDCYFNEVVLKSLIRRHDTGRFFRGHSVNHSKLAGLDGPTYIRCREQAQEKVKSLSARLRVNQRIVASLIREFKFPKNRSQVKFVRASIGSAAILPVPVLDLKHLFLYEADLSGINLENVGFFDSQLMGCDFTDTKLTRGTFSKSDLSGSNLKFCDLANAQLRHAILDGVKAYDTNFSDAQMDGVSLNELPCKAWGDCAASLNGANLAGTSLTNSSLVGVRIANARIDDRTNLEGENWWAADFRNGRLMPGIDNDEKLLQSIRSKFPIPKEISEQDRNQSVNEFLESLKRDTTARK